MYEFDKFVRLRSTSSLISLSLSLPSRFRRHAVCVSMWAHGCRRISCRRLYNNELTGPLVSALGQLTNLRELYVLVRPRLSLFLSLASRFRRHVVCVCVCELMVLVASRAGGLKITS